MGAVSFLVMALVPVLPVYVAGCVLAMTTSSAAIPLLTQIYQENYPERERGRRFARAMMIRIATAALFSDLAGRALSHHLDQFRWLLLIFAGAFCVCQLLPRALSLPAAHRVGRHPSVSRAALCAGRPHVPADPDRVDVPGLCPADDGAAAGRGTWPMPSTASGGTDNC